MVGIIGAGTMGAGIAQVAALHGWTVELMDREEAIVAKAIAGVRARLDRLVERGRLSAAERDHASALIRPATGPACLAPSALVIEAIVEDLRVKTEVLRAIVPALAPEAIIATNTSSLSVTAIGEAIGEAPRTVGMHFFNPAPLMRLVEVVATAVADPNLVDRVDAIARSWGKTTARCADVPGFIVNHCARPYYLEAFRILAEGIAPADAIDAAMRDLGGFRMGPLELTDLIGQDVNAATTRSVHAALGEPPLLAPSPLQESLVAAGDLGRKTGRGVYDHGVDPARPAVAIAEQPLALDDRAAAALDAFVAAATDRAAGAGRRDRYVFARILAALIAQAESAHARGVASREAIDVAMREGTNWPLGPFAWRDRIGAATCDAWCAALDAATEDGRFARPEAGRAPTAG